MQVFTTLCGVAAPLARTNIDTDVIICIERLTRIDRSGLGSYAFESLRYREDGSENPDFVLNQSRWRDAPIIVAGANFGCGSSREGAVWALMGAGIRCVIAESFGDIFYDNCFQNGLLPVQLPEPDVTRLMALARAGTAFTVDLEQQRVGVGGAHFGFAIDPWRRECLRKGLDSITYTLRSQDTIRAWQQRDRLRRPWAWPTSA